MMMWFFWIVLYVSFAPGAALRCWLQTSDSDPGKASKDCQDSATHCFVFDCGGAEGTSGHQFQFRGCAASGVKARVEATCTAVTKTWSECAGDNCNCDRTKHKCTEANAAAVTTAQYASVAVVLMICVLMTGVYGK